MPRKSPNHRIATKHRPEAVLKQAIAVLARRYIGGGGHGLTSPFELIVWDNVGYLVDDVRRGKLFEEFKTRVGLSALAMSKASDKLLLGLAQQGGMRPEERVVKWRSIASITLELAGGDLDDTLMQLPVAKAAALLKAFPSIGETGVDRILLLSGLDVRPALDSNGLRVLLRLGFVDEGKSYSTSYRAAKAELVSQGKQTRDWFSTAFHVLQAHGRAVCKRSAPLCADCPLQTMCEQRVLKGLY